MSRNSTSCARPRAVQNFHQPQRNRVRAIDEFMHASDDALPHDVVDLLDVAKIAAAVLQLTGQRDL